MNIVWRNSNAGIAKGKPIVLFTPLIDNRHVAIVCRTQGPKAILYQVKEDEVVRHHVKENTLHVSFLFQIHCLSQRLESRGNDDGNLRFGFQHREVDRQTR